MSIFKTLNNLFSNSFMEFLKDPSFGPLLFILDLHHSSIISIQQHTGKLSIISIQVTGAPVTCMLIILNLYHSELWISLITSLGLKTLLLTYLIFGLPQQLSKLDNRIIHLPNNVILSPVDSACNLGVIFDKNQSFALSAVLKSSFHNICDLRRISRPNTIN